MSLRLDTSVSSSILGSMAHPIDTIVPSSAKAEELKATLLLRLGERRMLAGCGASGSATSVMPEYIASILFTSLMMLV
jgi:hypothetical protein